MIVLEGPDNSGKSTLAAHLSYEFNIPVYHAGGPPTSLSAMMGRVKFILQSHNDFIFDRVPFISEQVYSMFRLGGNMLENSEEIYERFRALKPIIIYCRPPFEVLMEHDERGKKEHDTFEHLKKIQENKVRLIDRYDEVMQSELLPPCIHYDFTTQEHDILIKEIRNEIVRLGHYKGKALRPSMEDEQRTENG